MWQSTKGDIVNYLPSRPTMINYFPRVIMAIMAKAKGNNLGK